MMYSVRRVAAFFIGFVAVTLVQAESAISQYNEVWNSPSQDYNGSMPIGNGDLAANVWVEPTGDLIFYISKSDAWSGGNHDSPALLKLGRVRLQLDPPLVTEGGIFKQELDLTTGSITVDATLGDLERSIRFWIDANRSVINVEIDSSEPSSAEIAMESWRAEGKWLRGGAQKDLFLPSDGKTIRWYQRNVNSIMDDTLKVQRLGHLAGKFADPLVNRTFGGVIAGEGLKARDDRTLVTDTPAKRIHLRIHALTEQTKTAEAWLAQLEQQRKVSDALPLRDAWLGHLAWWNAFWDRSTIQLTGTKDAEAVARAYHLQRWIQAGAGRGAYPIKFNGSLFTVDGVDAHWAKPEGIYSGPDYRRWGGAYWWQNTRLIYWPMLYSGDYEMMRPLFNMYLEMLPLLRERTQHYFGHEGVFFVETIQLWGLQRNQDFGIDNKTFTSESPYTRWEWQSGLELSAMMLDYYQHTQDDAFARDTLLPIADEVITFYDQHYPKDKGSKGQLVITPAQALETWHTAVDPMPEVAGLHRVMDGLLALPKSLSSGEQQARWARLNGELPPIPIETKGGKTRLAPAALYARNRNGETPELYAVYPYQKYMIGKPNLDHALEAFKQRKVTTACGWSQDAINAAMLGLTEDVKRIVVERATAKNWGGKEGHTQSRFPAFWGPNVDWLPDQDHASVMITALQRMLLLTDGDTINLMPAWPDDWNATFKLHAPQQTVVEGRIENGKVVDLKVTPESRLKDVVFMGKGDGRGPAAVDLTHRTGMTATLKNYVEQFNAEEQAAESNAISNDETLSFLNKNVPLFECPDKEIERTYYYRWWTFRKHLRQTEDGWVVTEFYPDVTWAKKHNTINGDLGYQFYEGRWLHDTKILDDYMRFYYEKQNDGSFGKGVDAGGKRKSYSNWGTDGVYARFLVAANPEFTVSLLEGLIDNYEAWSLDNGKGWGRSRLLDSGPYKGLYWQVDSWGAQEFSIGGTGIRIGINSYLYGGAMAISRIAELAGKRELATKYEAKAQKLRGLVQQHLWDEDAKFFKTRRTIKPIPIQYPNTKQEACEPGALVSARELFGFVPWLFNLPEAGKGYEEAWKQLMDRQGFWGEYGPTTAERRHPAFAVPGGCQWHGASWPYSTSQILTGLANLLNNQEQDAIGKQEYFDTFKAYSRSHAWKLQDGTSVPWVDESVNPDTGKWIVHGNFPNTRGRFYNHSSYCDLVISGLVGLRPRADDIVEVNPLLPDDRWEYFRLGNILYHGRSLTIIWDKTGEKYKRGQGLTVFADGKKIAQSMTLSRVSGKLQ